ncbi:helix-turn-helix domain-containing protein [Alteribacter populi]|uniref:helix-turn-helix domain-containing protein n=1 Tax=Alteribacter populi TaxID=2011011 RepID=UPI003CC92442
MYEKGVTRTDLREYFSKSTVAKFKNNQDVMLSTVVRLCRELEVPIEKVVRIEYRD